MVVCGIDVGARTAKAVVLVDGEIAAHSVVRTGPESAAAAVAALERSLETTTLRREDIEFTVATGYGRVVVPFAQRNVTEIACHARGNHHFFPGVRTILDMGGQDCKAIRCDETGKVTNFLMNDKCAAGTGRALEVMASLLQVPLEDLGRLSLEASNGLAKNVGVVRRVEQKLGTTSQICFEPQVVGALGAALFARDFLTGGTRRRTGP